MNKIITNHKKKKDCNKPEEVAVVLVEVLEQMEAYQITIKPPPHLK